MVQLSQKRLDDSQERRSLHRQVMNLLRQQDQLIQDDSILAQTLHPLMGGLSLVFRVNTPGAILETDATRRSRNRAEWVFDFDSDPRVLGTLQNRNMTVIFDGQNIDLPEIGMN